MRETDQETFKELTYMCRNNAMAWSNACDPILLEPIVMSVLLGQRKRLIKLEKEMKELENRGNLLLEQFFESKISQSG